MVMVLIDLRGLCIDISYECIDVWIGYFDTIQPARIRDVHFVVRDQNLRCNGRDICYHSSHFLIWFYVLWF